MLHDKKYTKVLAPYTGFSYNRILFLRRYVSIKLQTMFTMLLSVLSGGDFV